MVRWLVIAVGVTLAIKLVSGIACDSGAVLFWVVLLLSFFNAVLKPLLVRFTLSFILLTLGLVAVVINALLFLLLGRLVEGFHIAGFWSAVGGSLVVSVSNLLASSFDGDAREINKWAREGIFILGGILGVIFVRAFLLNEVEQIGFTMVVNHLDRLSGSDFNTILNSSTFWKCFIGFLVGGFLASLAYRRHQSGKANKTAELKGDRQTTSRSDQPQKVSVETRLEELKRLRTKELISVEDFEHRKAELLKDL